jgi:hypothetical protein
VTVRDKITGNTSSIPLYKYNPETHVKVFGGIVVEQDGVKSYITREQFDSQGLAGIHKGKITATDKNTGIKRHITQDEYYADPTRFVPNGTGTTIVKDKITGVSSRVDTLLVKENPENWIIGTTGWATVYDIDKNKWLNIPKGTLDRTKHRLSQDKKFVCYNSDDSIRFEYWGGKADFLRQYKCPVSVWNAVRKQTIFRSNRVNSKEFDGCRFALVDWKKS